MSTWRLRLETQRRRLEAHAYIDHGLVLVHRTREVLAEEGPAEVVRRGRLWTKARLEERGLFQGWGTTQGVGSAAIETRYARWRARHDPTARELRRQTQDADSFAFQPLVSIVVPVFDPPVDVLRKALESALDQTYGRVELCVANAGRSRACATFLDELASTDGRVRLTHLTENLGISGNSNAALALATGEFVALLDHDDLLAPHAMYAIVEKLNAEPDLDILYSDEDRLAPSGRRILPYMKPEWSPEFLHSYMWPGHLSVYRRSLIESLGGFRNEYDGSQDYDLMLRATARTNRIAHVRGVLYHWRMLEGSAAAGGKLDARRTNLAALRVAIAAQGRAARVVEYPEANRVVFDLVDRPLVSIVIPTDDLVNVRATLNGIFARTTYDRYEVIVVTNADVAAAVEEENARDLVRCVVYDGAFNFSLKCNRGAAEAAGEYLLFLNDDVVPLTEGWIESMLQYAQQPEIGGVSPKLLYDGDRIQYAGLVTGVHDVVGTAFHTWPRRDGTYHSLAIAVRNVSCLTGACMLVRAADFHDVGGWDEVNTPISHSDFDLSFRLQDAGLRLVYTPFAELRHLGAASRRHAVRDERLPVNRADRGADLYLLHRWGLRVSEDPFYTSDMRELLYEDASDYRVSVPPERALEDGWWERPRVLLISHELSASGAPAMLFAAATALEQDGMLVVVTAPDTGPLESAYLEAGIPVIVDGDVRDRPERAARLMNGFDLVCINTVVNWRGVRVARAIGKPVVWFIHEPGFGAKAMRGLGARGREALQLADRVVFPSRATANLYTEFGATDRHRVALLGVPDVDDVAAAETPFERIAGHFYVVQVGSVEPRKGAHVLVEAIRRLPTALAERVHVLVVGRHLDPGYVSRLREELRTVPNVELVGEASRPTTLAYIRDADVLACTSSDEGTPVVIFEAMAFGTPVLTTAVGGVGEILDDGVDSLIVGVGDAAALAERIAQLASDPELCTRLSQAGRAAYERSFTAEHYGTKVTELVREVLAEVSPSIRELHGTAG